MSKLSLFLLPVLVLEPLLAREAPRAEADAELRILLRKLFEACKTRALVTGKFPDDYSQLESFLSPGLRRQLPHDVEFRNPESEKMLSARRSPLGERTPCLRLKRGDSWLNVACTGWIYESGEYWESNFVELLPRPFSSPGMLKRDARAMPARAAPRSSRCGPSQVNLAARCTAIPTGPWFWGPEKEDKAPAFGPWLKEGIAELDGVLFDVRGVVQLDGKVVPAGQGPRNNRSYPTEVKDIPVHAAARQLHLLLGTVGTALAHEVVASLNFKFASGKEERVPFRYGEHVSSAEDAQPAPERIYPPPGRAARDIYALHRLTLPSPRPGEEIVGLDFISGITNSHPFLLAITLEP